ncbi:hypothetical protein RFM23_00010 [Mesorhizobium abyssinicae]|uniref:Uncharacterized protein n=1 Tax=Mesorhizobium abyssinicae TaxID=1209958 RepID=A0ABU5AFH9_9HYPH|nr:hypothetical protein [Mesorhizobium abyssinicae]MDX8536001.1 hypothetical protein [Mesorhizobium abyssinicae]
MAHYIGWMAKGWTFQSLIDAKMTVTAFCQWSPCNHSQKLDLAQFRDCYGPDSPAMADDLIPRLKCNRCGGTAVGVIYTPDTSRNAYGKAKGS